MRLNRFFILAFSLFYTPFLSAQQEQTLNFMTDTWQAHLTNPALLPSKKIAIALPSVYFSINSPDMVLNDVVTTEGGIRKLDLTNLYAPNRPASTRINGHVQIQTLGIAFPINDRLSISAYQAAWANPSVSYRRDLIQLIFNGNSRFLGQSVSFGSSTQTDLRSEIGIGVVYRLPSLTLGGRVKILNGLAGVFTEGDKLDIRFNQTDYSLNFNTDFLVRYFAFDKIRNLQTIPDVINQGLFSRNRGMAFDVGGSFKLSKLQINASVLDIGSTLNWKTDGKSYASKGIYDYKGRNINDLDQFFRLDSLTSNSLVDSLKKVIGLVESSDITYVQKLPMKIYLSGFYDLTNKISLNALFYNESGGNQMSQTGFAIGASLKAVENPILKLHLGLNYGMRSGKFTNLGAHASAKLFKMVQIFAVTDNLITVFNPWGSTTANGRVGMGLIF
jgi:hypothetical protein